MDIRSGLQPVWVWAGVYFGETQNRLCINQRAVGPFLCKQQAVVCENCFVFLVILLALAVAQKLASLNELQHQVCGQLHPSSRHLQGSGLRLPLPLLLVRS